MTEARVNQLSCILLTIQLSLINAKYMLPNSKPIIKATQKTTLKSLFKNSQPIKIKKTARAYNPVTIGKRGNENSLLE